jgi:hypothetical protein
MKKKGPLEEPSILWEFIGAVCILFGGGFVMAAVLIVFVGQLGRCERASLRLAGWRIWQQFVNHPGGLRAANLSQVIYRGRSVNTGDQCA